MYAEEKYKDKLKDPPLRKFRMGIAGTIRRIRRRPLLILAFVFCYIFYSLYFSIDNTLTSSTLSASSPNGEFDFSNIAEVSKKVFSSLKFQNPLSLLITPHSLFDNNVIKKSATAPIILSNEMSKLFSNPEVENSSWRFISKFQNYRLDAKDDIALINKYISKRSDQHIYDPRITMSVYLNYLNEQLNSEESEIPFSWEDWVDLSYLNQFLESRDDNTCVNMLTDKKAYNVQIKTAFKPDKPSSYYLNDTLCLDNSEYMETPQGKFRDEKLLPGFNFQDRIAQKSNFIFKTYNAKSYLLSYAKPPINIFFLNDDGKYFKVKPYQSKSMMTNGLFENFIKKDTYDGFNPVEQLSQIDDKFLTIKQSDFANRLKNSRNYKIDIPESNFLLDTKTQFKDLLSKDFSELAENEKVFIDSILYSEVTPAADVVKYFKEVNINWPSNYNGHRLKENGGHFDARFFSGFISEMPYSEVTFRSPYYESNGKRHMVADTSTDRRSIVLSHLLHTLLTISFHDGLFLWPAHGSLLAWYFNAMSFPWDGDGDVQMPIKDLADFCLSYNQSMIVQNPKYGTGKYFVDCSSSLTHRGKETGNNNIDARIVDVDTGVFVDITGLAVSTDRLTNANMNKLGDWVPRAVRNVYPTKKSKQGGGKRKSDGSKRNLGPVAARIQEREATLKAAKSLTGNDMDEKILQIHSENKIYNCRNDHYYTYDMLSPVRLTLFEGAPTFVPVEERSLKTVLEQEYTNVATRRQAWEEWIFSKNLRMWISSQDVYESCKQEADASLRTRKGKKKSNKNVKGALVLSCYLHDEGRVLSEILKKSYYEITDDESFIKDFVNPEDGTSTFKQVRLNLVEEFYQDGVYVNAHTNEMSKFNPGWEWKTPALVDVFDLPKDWNSLATWMLDSHKPPKVPILDYLIYTEAHDQAEEIIFKSTFTPPTPAAVSISALSPAAADAEDTTTNQE